MKPRPDYSDITNEVNACLLAWGIKSEVDTLFFFWKDWLIIHGCYNGFVRCKVVDGDAVQITDNDLTDFYCLQFI